MNIWDYQAKKGKSMEPFVVEAFLVEESIDNWVIDSRANNHVCVSLQGFNKTRSLHGRSLLLRTGDGSYVSAEVVGEFILHFDNFRKIF